VIERVRRLGLEEGALALLVLLSVAAFARARPEPWGWLALLPVVAATPLRLARVPPAVQSWVERATWLLLGLMAATVLNWLLSPAGQGQPAPPLPAAAGYGLAALAALFLAGRALWSPARTAVPAALGVLVLAASQNRSSVMPSVGLATLAAVVLLAAARDAGPASGAFARVARFAIFGLAAAGFGWGIAWFLPWLQPKVIQAAARAAFPEAETGFSLETGLGDVEELRLSPRVVLRVWTDLPQKLRGAVATRFDGRRWHAAGSGPPEPLAHAGSPAETVLASRLEGVPGETFRVPGAAGDGELVATRLVQVGPLEGALVAPAGVALLRGPLARVLVDAAGILSPSAAAGQVYGTLNRPGPDGSDEPAPALLELPSDTDPRLRDLAARLAAGAPDPAARVARTLAFLQGEYAYSLRVGRFRSVQPVAEFLFEKKQGWCQYFASAAALLLRLQGVPTRYVSGFQVRPGLWRGGHYVVREADAHAWIEAWLPGRGWMEADPTPPAGYDAAHGEPAGGRWAEGWEWLKGALDRMWAAEWRAVPGLIWDELRTALREPLPRSAALAAGVFLVLLVARAAWRRARAWRPRSAVVASHDVPPELARLLTRLDRAWAHQGVPRPASRGPLEHLEGTASRLPPRLREASRRAVDTYYGARFGGGDLPPTVLAAVLAELGQAERDAAPPIRTGAPRSDPGARP
jgi:transglutaminase-like putative cysteine protease